MIEIADRIYWNGLRDWELRKFHGHEFSTHRGSSYNSYVIRDSKTVLVDTVWDPYRDEFADSLEKEIGLENVDMIVINHMEPDHGGSLGKIMSLAPDIPIYCTHNGADIIKKHYHKDWDFRVVKTGDTVSTGEYELVFVEMRMLHWPDSMLTYIKGPGVVLSNDAFGQHYAAVSLFNDEVDNCELYQEALRYYANILAPFSALVKKKIDELKELGLSINMIAPSHGVIWRKDPMQIVDRYYEWADGYSENFAVVVYDTMYNSTRRMAEAIARGMNSEGIPVKIFNCSTEDPTDLLTEIFRAKGVVMGSCTVNNTLLRSTAAILSNIGGLRLKGKHAASFGSYGWSGEAPGKIAKSLESSGFNVELEPLKVQYRPDEDAIGDAAGYGRRFANLLK